MIVKFKLTENYFKVPEKATDGASGHDLYAALPPGRGYRIYPGERRLVPTGVCLQIPRGWEAQVRPRSGLALKKGITVLNSPGTIDSDYRGEIGVVIINHGDEPFDIERGDRIGQLVFQQVTDVIFVNEELFDETERGEGGFGSTLVKG